MQAPASTCAPARPAILWLQIITLLWMLVECAVSAYAAVTAHSPALLAFGSDSLVELLSATVVLLQWTPRFSLSERTAARTASVLLYALAGIVVVIAILSILLAAITLAGLGLNALFHIAWFDSLAALAATPLLLKEARAAWRGHTCSCC